MKFCDFRQCKQPVFSGEKCFNHRIKTPLKRSAKTARRKRIRYGRKEIHDYTKTQVKKDLDIIFSAFIRMRDADDNGVVFCISSGKPYHWSQVDNGHYLPRSLAPGLIFHPDNCHAQSKIDNWHEGNRLEYRRRLIEKIGLSRVEHLESIQHQKSGLGLFELKLLLLQYCEQFKQQCERLKYSPNITQQRVLDRWENK